MKKGIKILGYLIGIFVLIILVLVFSVWIKSPGTPDKVTDRNGNIPENSISTIATIPIGGIEQAVIIRGEDATKPVLLVLHGGPGSPGFPLMKNTGLNLEQEFVVAHWEQRGAGKSYYDDIPIESMTITQMIEDAVEVTKYLQTRFDKDKIYLMGHSWGSQLGTLLAHQNPEFFNSYIGIGQVSRPYVAERLSLEFIKAAAQEADNESDISSIKALILPDSLDDNKTWTEYLFYQRDFVNKYGGGLRHKDSNIMDLYKSFLFSTPEYTIKNKINYMDGVSFSHEHLWDDVIQANLSQQIDSIAIPVHIFHGIHDFQTTFKPAKIFFDQLKAPEKHLYTFEFSAHAPFLDEPEKFNQIIIDSVLIQN